MLFSLAVIMLSGFFMGWLCKKIHFPALFGMILAGIAIGPYALNLIDASVLDVSSEIRRIALIVILIRAGLKLDLSDLKKVGRPAILMCFLPACFEVLGMVLCAPKILEITTLEAAILGAVIAAVSPAVVVPRMIKLMEEGYGTKEGIPQMILAGASVDDVFVIVLFTTFTGLALGDGVSVMSFVNIPISIVIGVVVGLAVGYGCNKWFSLFAIPDVVKMMLILSISFLLNYVENTATWLPFASLLAIMCLGIPLRKKQPELAANLSKKYDQIWIVAEVFLFVLVGASVAIDTVADAGWKVLALLVAVLLFRMVGVFFCVFGTKLSIKEKIFCMLAYTPKATVQAAIGGLPLAMGLPCGQLVLTVSVIAILVTAPCGAFAIDFTYQKLLKKA